MDDKLVFDSGIQDLKLIFSDEIVESMRCRLKEIFDITTNQWKENLHRFNSNSIQKLLICEAPPWSESGIPRYFYNKIESKYHKRIWKGIFPENPIPDNQDLAYRMLSDKGFLLIDSIPYSMPYKGKRTKIFYDEMIIKSIPWWTSKLQDSSDKICSDLKVAFAFKVNGLAIINALNGTLNISEKIHVKLSLENIAADNSGYTNSGKLYRIFSGS